MMKTNLKSRACVFASVAIVGFSLTACDVSDLERLLDGDDPGFSSSSTPVDVNQEGDYFEITGTAERNYEANPDEVKYCDLDELDRAVCAYGELTFKTREDAQKRGRQPLNVDPAAWPDNEEVDIPALDDVEGSKDYHGWFYNRSHMLGDSLGGDPIKENLVTGTRPQNVGSVKNSGGMAYTETIARDYLDSEKSKDCPLYYAAAPQYEGDEMLPRTVTVDIQTCDKEIDEHVVVDNTANGWSIDYSDGSFTKD